MKTLQAIFENKEVQDYVDSIQPSIYVLTETINPLINFQYKMVNNNLSWFINPDINAVNENISSYVESDTLDYLIVLKDIVNDSDLQFEDVKNISSMIKNAYLTTESVLDYFDPDVGHSKEAIAAVTGKGMADGMLTKARKMGYDNIEDYKKYLAAGEDDDNGSLLSRAAGKVSGAYNSAKDGISSAYNAAKEAMPGGGYGLAAAGAGALGAGYLAKKAYDKYKASKGK